MVQATHFVICDEQAIWAVGVTQADAWADFRRTMKRAHIQVLSRDDYVYSEDAFDPRPAIIEDFHCVPATEALAAEIEQCGGDIGWGEIDGIACTVSEKDGE